MVPNYLHILISTYCVITLSVEWPVEYRRDGMSPIWLCYNLCLANRLCLLPFQPAYFDEISGHVGEVHKAKNGGQSPIKNYEGPEALSQKVLQELNSANNLTELWSGPFPSWAFRWDHSCSLVRNPKIEQSAKLLPDSWPKETMG